MKRQTLAPTLVTDSHGLTLKGRLRSHNEDAILWPPLARRDIAGRPLQVVAVADGVGGAPLGEVASSTAIAALRESFRRVMNEPAEALRAAFLRANRAVLETTEQEGGEGSATTLVAVLRNAEYAWIGNVGDSRAYLIREGDAVQVTIDHLLGPPGPSFSATTPSVLTRAVGSRSAPQTDIFGPLELREHDALLLCSDGIHGVVETDEIAETVSILEPLPAVTHLCEFAVARGGDDASAVLCRIGHIVADTRG